MKKWKKRLILLLVVAMAMGGYRLYHYMRIKNVFDEIFYSELELKKKGKANPSLGNVENINKGAGWGSRDDIWYEGYFMLEQYKREVLDADKYMSIEFINGMGREQMLAVKYIFTFAEKIDLYIRYEYYVSKKQVYEQISIYDGTLKNNRDIETREEIESYLKKYNISKEEVQALAQEGLYEIFLTDWFEGNKKYTRFSMEDLGDVEIIRDDLFD